MCNAAAISSAEAGALLTCRKRSMLSGLSCGERGIRGRSGGQAPIILTILLNFFWSDMKLFSRPRGFIARPTHDRPAALRQAGRHSRERGKRGGREDRPAPPFFLL